MHMPRERAIQASVCVLVDPHGAQAFFGRSRGAVRSAGETAACSPGLIKCLSHSGHIQQIRHRAAMPEDY